MIVDKVVIGEQAALVPGHFSYGQYLVDKLRENSKNGTALINGETSETATFQRLLQDVVNISVGLQSIGLKRGDVVGMCSESRIEYITTAIAVICCGATVTAVNLQYTKDEMLHVFNISKPSFIIGSSSALKKNGAIFRGLSFVKKIFSFDGASEGSVPLSSVVGKDVNVDTFLAADVKGWTDVAYILYSSGTTGLPKGVMLTNLNSLYGAILSYNRSKPGTRIQTVVPWYHGFGLMSTINSLAAGCIMVYFSEFNLEKYLGAIQKYKVQNLLTVPPIVVLLAKSPIVERFDLSSVSETWCAAAPLSMDTIREAMKRLPNCKGIFQAYGMTETTLSATKDQVDSGNQKVGSGGCPLPGIKVKVVDVETRQKLGPKEKGEICIKGPIVMKGYAGNEAATRAIFDDEGFLKTGDIGFYDEEGYFFIVDRLKELIKYKGFQVPPAEVESVLLQHPGVAECGVVGAPDEAAGELPTAFVVAKPGAKITQQELLDFSASRLSPAKRLRGGIIFVNEIPKNGSGKILRRVLRQKLQEMHKSKL
ncbi:luciferin 4-monooxygenase-like isoform X2 [Choristoneura fumiferana]